MTRILVQRGSSGSSSLGPSRSSSSGSSSSSPSRSSSSGSSSSSARAEPQVTVPPASSAGKDEDNGEEVQDLVIGDEVSEFPGTDDSKPQSDDFLTESFHNDQTDTLSDEITDNKDVKEEVAGIGELMKGLSGLRKLSEKEVSKEDSSPTASGTSYPPPPPVPPPRPSAANLNSRNVSGNSNAVHIGSPRRGSAGHVSARTSPAGSRPSSPRSHNENEGYNSADEQSPCFVSSYDDLEREQQFEIDIRKAKGCRVKIMAGDGNCLFRAVADQVYGDPELYDLTRQMCMDYMERERDHFSQFITEGFMSYCKRKRRDQVYGNNIEIQAMCEIYNRPIHIYSYSTEPINIFQGSYDTDTPPIRLSYHQGNHYNSLVDPRRSAIGAGLGFSCLRGNNVDKDQVKAAIKAQQDQQIDNALIAEGRFYSDLELTEKEIERTVMEVSRAEYLANEQVGRRGSSTSKAEPSSSGSRSDGKMEDGKEEDTDMGSSMQMVLSMGFSYAQVIEGFSIFGDDVDSVVCYLLETGSNSRRKGKATE